MVCLPFYLQGLEYLRGVGDSDNIQRYLHPQGSTSLLSQPSLSGASCESFDVDRSSSNEGKILNPVCLSFNSFFNQLRLHEEYVYLSP